MHKLKCLLFISLLFSLTFAACGGRGEKDNVMGDTPASSKSSLTPLYPLITSITMKVLNSELFLNFHYDDSFYPCRSKNFVGFFS